MIIYFREKHLFLQFFDIFFLKSIQFTPKIVSFLIIFLLLLLFRRRYKNLAIAILEKGPAINFIVYIRQILLGYSNKTVFLLIPFHNFLAILLLLEFVVENGSCFFD